MSLPRPLIHQPQHTLNLAYDCPDRVDQLTLKAVNYVGLIPVLIANAKEQQVQIAALQQQLAACCAASDDSNNLNFMPAGGSNGGSTASDLRSTADDQLKIQPNPFSGGTTVSYMMTDAGQVRLIVSTMAGKQLQVLEEDYREPGRYSYEWNTSALASGIYNVMLVVDGAPVMQKAAKMAR